MIPVTEVNTSIPGSTPTREERETIIIYNEVPNEPATVFTYNSALIRKLDALTEERAEEVQCTRAESINGVQLREYTLPKKWVKINPSRILTVEEKAIKAERMKHNREKAILSRNA